MSDLTEFRVAIALLLLSGGTLHFFIHKGKTGYAVACFPLMLGFMAWVIQAMDGVVPE
jgi:hypothetical protein